MRAYLLIAAALMGVSAGILAANRCRRKRAMRALPVETIGDFT